MQASFIALIVFIFSFNINKRPLTTTESKGMSFRGPDQIKGSESGVFPNGLLTTCLIVENANSNKTSSYLYCRHLPEL